MNDKRLRDLFKKLIGRTKLTADQDELFNYLLKKIFPEYKNNLEESLLERIKYRSLEEVAFGNNQEIIDNIPKDNDRYLELKKLFKVFIKLESENTDEIRKNLVKLSNLLDRIYQYEVFQEPKMLQYEGEGDKIENDSIEEERISDLHSHILAFLRWLPIVPQDKTDDKMLEKVMESIDNVIDEIRVRACEIIDSNSRLCKNIHAYPKNSHDIIFVQEDGAELRRLLINAMYHEPNICLQFKKFYGEAFSERNKEGNVNE